MSNPPRSVNLTGSARVLHDHVVTIFNAIQKWKDCMVEGVHIIRDLQDQQENDQSIESKCEKLGELVGFMESYVEALQDCSKKIQILCTLHPNAPPPCYSWSMKTIAEVIDSIVSSYVVDTQFKSVLVATGLQKKSFSQLSIIAIFWVHGGQINSLTEATLDAVLRECFLKT